NDLLKGRFEGGNALYGGDGNDTLEGSVHGDLLSGGAGNDVLTGDADSRGNDTFVFDVTPGAANADLVTDFSELAQDHIRLDGSVMTALGASGIFSAGDARFYAAAGANAGHDTDDRVVYDTTTGQLWYDADGSG